jgi:hypothetical protein
MERTASKPMTRKQPFAVPHDLPADLARVLAYWRGLLRGDADMPFADDLKPTDLPDLTGRLFQIDVFEHPTRFRVASVGADLGLGDAPGRFLDEVEFNGPLAFLASQCAATVEAAVPTYYRSADGREGARIILPLWGEGRISTLFGAIDFS